VRSFLIFLSQRKFLRRWLETSSLARRLASRFVAGHDLDQALAACREMNSAGITVTLDHLGESVTSLEEAAEARDVYLRALNAIHDSGVQANVSIKLTQFGLDFSADACRANVEQLVEQAARLDSFVRIDMEDSSYVDRTLDTACDMYQKYGHAGVVIQAYLYRSAKDTERLCQQGIRVRLCKGTYLEHADVAFPRKPQVDANYIALMKVLLDRGQYPAIATHDPKMIEATKAYVAEHNIPRDAFEFQMLYGIRRDLQQQLVQDGYRMRVYVPFGKAWYPYYMRRLAERPANVFFILRNVFKLGS
jgi:proline dehydrogenase